MISEAEAGLSPPGPDGSIPEFRKVYYAMTGRLFQHDQILPQYILILVNDIYNYIL